MACKCFRHTAFLSADSLAERMEYYKCTCSARFSVEEKGKTFTLKDATIKETEKYKIDEGVIVGTQNNKCDFLFVYQNKRYIFVELKGADVKHAFAQIDATMYALYNAHLLNQQQEVRCCIVFSTYPKDNGTVRKLQTEMVQKWKNKVNGQKFFLKKIRMVYSVKTDNILG